MKEISKEEFYRQFRPADYDRMKKLGVFGNTEIRQTRNDPGLAPGVGYSAADIAAEIEDQATQERIRKLSEENTGPRLTKPWRAKRQQDRANTEELKRNFLNQIQVANAANSLSRASGSGRIAQLYKLGLGTDLERPLSPQQMQAKAVLLEQGFPDAQADLAARFSGKALNQRQQRALKRALISMEPSSFDPATTEIKSSDSVQRAFIKIANERGITDEASLAEYLDMASPEKKQEFWEAARNATVIQDLDNAEVQRRTGRSETQTTKGTRNPQAKRGGGGAVDKFLIPMLLSPATEEFTDPRTGTTRKQPATYQVPRRYKGEVSNFTYWDPDNVNLRFIDPTATVSPELAAKFNLFSNLGGQEWGQSRGITDIRSNQFNQPTLDGVQRSEMRAGNYGDPSLLNTGANIPSYMTTVKGNAQIAATQVNKSPLAGQRPMTVGEALSYLSYQARSPLVKLRTRPIDEEMVDAYGNKTGEIRRLPAEIYEIAGGDINDPNSAKPRIFFQRAGGGAPEELFDLPEGRRNVKLTPEEINLGYEVFRRGDDLMYGRKGMQELQDFIEALTGERLLVNEPLSQDWGMRNLQTDLVEATNPAAVRKSMGAEGKTHPLFGLMRLFTESGRIPRQGVKEGLPAVFNVESSVPAEIAQAYKAADPATRKEMVKTVSPLRSALMAMPIETGETLGAWSAFVKGLTPEVQETMTAINPGYAENIAKQYASENPANRLNALQEISRFRQRRGV